MYNPSILPALQWQSSLNYTKKSPTMKEKGH
jgi:hypothetical protein